jgi:uncharacterized protein (TIGR02145 family)
MTVLLLSPVLLLAQNGVEVTGFNVDAGTVTFNVSWDKNTMPVSVWSDTVWVFVDYNKNGVMTHLPLTGATLTNSSSAAATAMTPLSTNRGAWVVGNARNADSFSASVELYYDAQTAVAGACAYAMNYPPVGEYISTTHISFVGTPMYNIVLKDAGTDTIYRTSGADFDIPEGYALISFTDATGAPGIIKCIPPPVYTLTVSASSFCAGDAGVTFALDGTDDEKNYQLYRNNSAVIDAVLSGTGSAGTFAGTFNEAGTYSARTIADELYCAIAMSETHVITKNPLPTNPDVTGDSRNCPGTVTLSASSSGAVIDWYADDVMTSTLHTGESYTTPEIRTSTTYYVQARVESTGCLSARVAVAAEVDMDGCCDAPGVTGVTFAAFNPCSIPDVGATWTLTDARDSKTYKVKYMADGRYWMAQDLKFGDGCNKASFSGSTSDQKGKVNSSGTYYGDCATSPANTDVAGYVYDWAAAMNAPNAYKGATACFTCTSADNYQSCRGICPAGWHVPTKAEMDVLLNNIGKAGFRKGAVFELPYGGVRTPGGQSLTRTQLHTSTCYTAYAQHTLCSAEGHEVGYYSGENSWHEKTGGFTLRCLRN